MEQINENVHVVKPATEEEVNGTPGKAPIRVKLTIETVNPETGEPFVRTVEGQGAIFAVMTGEVKHDDADSGYNVSAGGAGAFCDKSLAITMNALDNTIYQDHPIVRLLRSRGGNGSGGDALSNLLGAIFGGNAPDNDEDDDEDAESDDE